MLENCLLGVEMPQRTIDMKSQPTQVETIADLAARGERPDQFANFDRGVRASLSVSKEAVLKAEALGKRSRARKRAKKSHG
jgi:hypothetical protein